MIQKVYIGTYSRHACVIESEIPRSHALQAPSMFHIGNFPLGPFGVLSGSGTTEGWLYGTSPLTVSMQGRQKRGAGAALAAPRFVKVLINY